MEIIWTFKAKDDLKNIYVFLMIEISEQRAFEIITKIVDRVDILYRMPLVGQKEPKFEELKREYRRLIESDYKIVYHIRKDKIYINRVFDTRQNPKKLTIF